MTDVHHSRSIRADSRNSKEKYMQPDKTFTTLKNILTSALIVGVAVWITNNLKTYQTIGHAPRQTNTIVVSGEGKVTATPNIATVTVGILTQGNDVARAQKENTEKMNALVAAVKKIGIEEGDIQTTTYYINPRYNYREGRSEIEGYEVSQSVTVKIRDLSKISAVLAAAGEHKANQVSGVNFSIDEPENLRVEARAKAIERARDMAKAISKGLGVKLGRVVAFNESGNGFPVPMPYLAERASSGMGGPDMMPQPKIEPGSQEIVVQVSVTYEIR